MVVIIVEELIIIIVVVCECAIVYERKSVCLTILE